MKTERLPKILITAFVFALVIYVLMFSFIQNRRTRKGPWKITFQSDATGRPALMIEQTKLNISQKIVFPDEQIAEKNLEQLRVFEDPNQTNAPFGEIVFQDLTFLPGTVTFNFFGHGVEVIPRVLTIDKQEHPWKNSETITVTGEGKFTPRPQHH
jgi:hypothetical protein